jgi:hypothetical protein
MNFTQRKHYSVYADEKKELLHVCIVENFSVKGKSSYVLFCGPSDQEPLTSFISVYCSLTI